MTTSYTLGYLFNLPLNYFSSFYPLIYVPSPQLLNTSGAHRSLNPRKPFSTCLLCAIPRSSAYSSEGRGLLETQMLDFSSFHFLYLFPAWGVVNEYGKKNTLFLQLICTAFSLPSLVETQVGMSINSFSSFVTSAEITRAPLNAQRCFMLVRHITLSSYLVREETEKKIKFLCLPFCLLATIIHFHASFTCC